MVQFSYIKITNFRSVKNATLHFNSGVWRVLGTNNDTDGFDSNASGKSTVLSALQQCLFNRTIFGTAIEDSYHKQGGVGYILETIFYANDNYYKVINDRTAMKITIFEMIDVEFVDMGVRSIPHAISVIQDLIGMDFNTFIATTYISHSTVVEMIDHFTSSALLKIVLNFDRLYNIEKAVKKLLVESVETTRLDSSRSTSIKESLTILDAFTKTNITPLKVQLESLTAQKAELLSGALQIEINNLQSRIKLDSDYVAQQNIELKKLNTTLNTTVCHCCGQSISVDKVTLDDKILTIESTVKTLSNSIAENKETLEMCYDEMRTELAKIENDISYYTNAISVATYKNDLYQQYKKQADDLRKELVGIEYRLVVEHSKQDVYQAICDTIKSGAPLKDLIHNFCTALNIYIDEFTPLVSIDYVNIKARAKKNSLDFVVHDTRFNSTITVNELSGGELMRVRVILLLSLLKAIHTLTGVASNILIFDEALDALDASAANDLAVLFSHLSNSHDKFIALVSHGNQLNTIEFDGFIHVTKNNGVSVLAQDIAEN